MCEFLSFMINKNASGCTSLTQLPDLANLKTLYASGCTSLTQLDELRRRGVTIIK